MTRIAAALIQMYPREWRQRYGTEMRALLESERISLRTLADLVGGAIDARLNPQLAPALDTASNEGVRDMNTAWFCTAKNVSPADAWKAAALMVGGSFVLAASATLLQLQIGANSLSESLMLSAFPAALMLSSPYTYQTRCSFAARRIMAIGGAIVIILMVWGATALGKVI